MLVINRIVTKEGINLEDNIMYTIYSGKKTEYIYFMYDKKSYEHIKETNSSGKITYKLSCKPRIKELPKDFIETGDNLSKDYLNEIFCTVFDLTVGTQDESKYIEFKQNMCPYYAGNDIEWYILSNNYNYKIVDRYSAAIKPNAVEYEKIFVTQLYPADIEKIKLGSVGSLYTHSHYLSNELHREIKLFRAIKEKAAMLTLY
jgi:hypothetical protein